MARADSYCPKYVYHRNIKCTVFLLDFSLLDAKKSANAKIVVFKSEQHPLAPFGVCLSGMAGQNASKSSFLFQCCLGDPSKIDEVQLRHYKFGYSYDCSMKNGDRHKFHVISLYTQENFRFRMVPMRKSFSLEYDTVAHKIYFRCGVRTMIEIKQIQMFECH